MKKVREKATCIAFYDFNLKMIDLEYWFNKSIKFFEFMNIPLVYFSAYAEDIKWKKVKTFKYGKKYIEKRGFENLKSLSIESDSPPENPNSIEREAASSINISNRPCMIIYANEKILFLDRVKIERIVIDFLEIIQPNYGIVFKREYFKGPIFYIWGIIMGLDSEKPEEKKERQKLTTWNDYYIMSDGKYRTGLLRDIYPLNLLSQTHLDEPVYGTTLESWIKSSSDHGSLKPLTPDLWSWWVPEDKIPIVANKLKESGIIICV